LADFYWPSTSGLDEKQRLTEGVLMQCNKKDKVPAVLDEDEGEVPTYVWGRGYRVNDNDRAGDQSGPPLTPELIAQVFPNLYAER